MGLGILLSASHGICIRFIVDIKMGSYTVYIHIYIMDSHNALHMHVYIFIFVYYCIYSTYCICIISYACIAYKVMYISTCIYIFIRTTFLYLFISTFVSSELRQPLFSNQERAAVAAKLSQV